MAITSLNQIVNALGTQKGFLHPYQLTTNFSYTSGRFAFLNVNPGLHGSFSFSGTNLAFTNCDNTTPGGFFAERPTPGPGEQIYLGYCNVMSNSSSFAPTIFYLVDIIGYYFNINTNTTTTQTLTGTVNLRGYPYALAALVVSSTTGSTFPNATINYTNENNVANRSSTTLTHSSVAPFNLMQRSLALNLQSGDKGIRSVQSITFSAATTGAAHLMLFVPLATVPYLVWNVAGEREFVTQIPALPTIPQNACLGLVSFFTNNVGTGAVVFGTMQFVMG